MTDICFYLCTCGSVVVSDATAVAELKADNERLRTALRLIAEHPVEQSGQWEVGAREMLRLSRATLGGKND
jgi:hypothetical protein